MRWISLKILQRLLWSYQCNLFCISILNKVNLPIFYVTITNKREDEQKYKTKRCLLNICLYLKFWYQVIIYIYDTFYSQILQIFITSFILTCVSFNLLYHDTYKHEGVSNASYMVFSTHVNVSMFEVKIPLKQNMRMKFNEVDWMAENHSKR